MKKVLIAMLLGMTLLFAVTANAQSTASVTLTWTAPGDDGNVGTATQYDLRYSTSAITAANFASATRWMSAPVPLAAGTVQTSLITGLALNTTYYFAIKTADDAGNWAGISNVASKLTSGDLIRPATIALTVGTITDTTVALNWTAVGGDSLSGTAASYDVRYSTTGAITAATWATATQVSNEPTPAASGTAQSYTVTGLTRQLTYYFAIRAVDGAGNMSAVSNSPSATTSDTMAPGVITTLTAN